MDSETGILLRKTTLAHTGGDADVEISHAGSMTVVLPPDICEDSAYCRALGSRDASAEALAAANSATAGKQVGQDGLRVLALCRATRSAAHLLHQLFWSGNWQYYVRRNPQGRVVLAGGLNSWGLRHTLARAIRSRCPICCSAAWRATSTRPPRLMHRYLRRRRPDPERVIPVQFNSWFPYQGEPPVDTMKAYAKRPSELGCEIFVLDAGWYTTQTENPDEGWWLRTGDWLVNRKLFPNGLEELSDYCRGQGMDFGIWIEPEAVGPSAIIRHEHPEWMHNIGGRVPPADQRAILNLGVPEARAWIRERMIALVLSTGARWLKWDFNIDLFQGGWAEGLPTRIDAARPA